MNRTLRRTLSIAVVSASALLSAFAPALAAGNWSWTDISTKIAERQNRPVWAMAYASPYWYFTDGQELWSGGHVWKTEGSIVSDITADVRNMGISRVDDIVSDGQSVVFLKNVMARNNSVEIVSYANGTYFSRTNAIRSLLTSNEGLVSVHGNKGSWAFVTTNGRLLVSDGNWSFVNPSLPNQWIERLKGEMTYRMTHDTSSEGRLLVAIVPLGSSWLVAYEKTDGQMSYMKYAYPYSLTDVTSTFKDISTLVIFSSNGSQVLVGGRVYHGYGAWSTVVYAYDGATARTIAPSTSMVDFLHTAFPKPVAYTGTSWMFINGKKLIRFDGTEFQDLGEARDYFVTAASNGSGTVLLGGVESIVGSAQPTFPLRLKLVKVEEAYLSSSSGGTTSGTFGGGRTSTSFSGPSITTSGNPFNFRVGTGGTFIYRATATDVNGVERIDLYANSALIKTCYADSCEFSAQYFANGLSTRMIPLTVRATDRIGYSTDATLEYLTVDQSSASANSSNSAQTSSAGTSYWTWLEPNQTAIRRDQTVGFNVGAYDADGIKRIEVYMNGTIRRTCDFGRAYGNQTCIATIYGYEYLLGTSVAVNAKITDGTDQATWTTLQNQYITDVAGSTSGGTTNGDVSAWTSFEPTGSTLTRDASKTIRVQANASQGLSRIEVYVNGSVRRTCNLTQAYGTQSCDLTVYGTEYSSGNQLSVNALATDYYGRTAWSDTKQITVETISSSGGTTTSGNGSSWTWSDPSVNAIRTNQDVTFSVGANDADGIRRIEMVVNGAIARTCDTGSVIYGNSQCSVVIRGSNYSAGMNVYVNAKITDAFGNTFWSDSKNYNVTASDSGTTSGDASGSVGITSNADGGYTGSQSITFTATATDPDGIQKIDILVNGAIVQTCYGASSCVYVGGSYSDRSSVGYGANMTDSRGNVTWTGYKTISKQ